MSRNQFSVATRRPRVVESDDPVLQNWIEEEPNKSFRDDDEFHPSESDSESSGSFDDSDIDTDVETDGDTDVNTDAETDVETDAETDVETDVDTDVDTDVETDMNPDVDVEVVDDGMNTDPEDIDADTKRLRAMTDTLSQMTRKTKAKSTGKPKSTADARAKRQVKTKPKTKRKAKRKAKPKTRRQKKQRSRTDSRMSKGDNPNELQKDLRPDELELFRSQSKSRYPQRRGRKPPARYTNRRDVKKHIRNHYLSTGSKNKQKTETDSIAIEALIAELEKDAQSDPVIRTYVDEVDCFTDEEGYDTEEERRGKRKRAPSFDESSVDSLDDEFSSESESVDAIDFNA